VPIPAAYINEKKPKKKEMVWLSFKDEPPLFKEVSEASGNKYINENTGLD